MRIAVDIKAFKNGNTGIARYLREILDSLQRLDQSNEYFLFSSCNSDYNIVNRKWKIYSENWKLPGIVWQQIKLPFLLKKHKIDILWAPEQICPIFGIRNIKIITTIHDNVSYHFPKTVKFTAHVIFKFIYPRVLKRSNLLITVSEYIKNDTLKIFKQISNLKDKIIAIPNGKPNWKIPQNYKPENRNDFLLYVGNPEPRKNLISLIKALEILHENGLDIKLHLVGPKGWKNKKFFNYLEHSPISKNIVSLGYLTDNELEMEYLNCKALIYPSLYEGFGLPLLEALSLDTLVLTSKDTVMEEVAGKSAMYFNATEAKDMAKHIKNIYNKNFSRNKYLKNATVQLNKYSWENTTKTLMKHLTT